MSSQARAGKAIRVYRVSGILMPAASTVYSHKSQTQTPDPRGVAQIVGHDESYSQVGPRWGPNGSFSSPSCYKRSIPLGSRTGLDNVATRPMRLPVEFSAGGRQANSPPYVFGGD